MSLFSFGFSAEGEGGLATLRTTALAAAGGLLDATFASSEDFVVLAASPAWDCMCAVRFRFSDAQ